MRKGGLAPFLLANSAHGGDLATDYPKRYTKRRKIGDGSEGWVELWEHMDSETMIAVKVIRARQAMPREVEILKDLPPHKSIVQLFAYFQKLPQADADCMLFEYCPAGDLFDLQQTMWRKSKSIFSEAFMWAIFRQIAEALAFLHEGLGCEDPHNADIWRPVVHRDVKLENVFISSLGVKDDLSSLKIKLGDFGLSAFYHPNDSKMPGAWGTSILWPPEQTWEGREATPAGDVWAIGCIVHELAHGFPPVVDPELTERFMQKLPDAQTPPASWSPSKKKSYWASITERKPLPINLDWSQHVFDKRRNRPTPKYSDELNACMQMALTMNVKDRPAAGQLKESIEEQEAAFHFKELENESKTMEKEMNGDSSEEDFYF
ncbi:kinase-like protein [Byssothecium circinans]|uniref:non-specific serine/threonine protein kinase n=1 Tax=Byssothecium circinans TaxID=147558 RepID=A0A6A5U9M1_9PLEO|nr:kinase-like protein [Byssothecium circinans]